MTHGLHRTEDDGVLTLEIDRPERMNALDGATTAALIDALTALGPRVRVVVITGRGPAFSTGADIVELSRARPTTDAEARLQADHTMDVASSLIRAVIDAPVPVIAQVNGIAAGIGVSLALAADLSYAAEDATFLLAFTGVGLMPDGGASLLVPAAIGRARAAAMALLGEPMTARDAAASGLITQALPADELAGTVASVARRLAHGPARALRLTKQALTASTLALLGDALAREREGQIELLTAPEFRDRVGALLGRKGESPQT
jgi:enoyl-CoA hydratase